MDVAKKAGLALRAIGIAASSAARAAQKMAADIRIEEQHRRALEGAIRAYYMRSRKDGE